MPAPPPVVGGTCAARVLAARRPSSGGRSGRHRAVGVRSIPDDRGPRTCTATRSASARISSRSSEMSRIAAPAVTPLEEQPVGQPRPRRRPGRGWAGRRSSGAARTRSRARGSGAGCCRRRAGAPAVSIDGADDVVVGPSAGSRRPRAAPMSIDPAVTDGRRAVALHDQVVDQREVRRGTDAGPVLGHVRHAAPGSPRGPAGWRRPRRRPGRWPRHGRRPLMTSASSLWPLPATAAMPTISPARTSSETPRSAGTPLSPSRLDLLEREHGFAGSASASRSRLSRTSRPTISVASWAFVAPAAGQRRRRDLPPAHDGDPVGDREDLAQLVADEHDDCARRGHRRAASGQVVDLLGRQDGRRLVHDQDPWRRDTAP